MKHAGDELSDKILTPKICVMSVVVAVFQSRNPACVLHDTWEVVYNGGTQHVTDKKRLDVTHQLTCLFFCIFGQGQSKVCSFSCLCSCSVGMLTCSSPVCEERHWNCNIVNTSLRRDEYIDENVSCTSQFWDFGLVCFHISFFSAYFCSDFCSGHLCELVNMYIRWIN